MFHLSGNRVNEILMKFFLDDFQWQSNFSVWLRTFCQSNFKAGWAMTLQRNPTFYARFPLQITFLRIFSFDRAWATCQHVDDPRRFRFVPPPCFFTFPFHLPNPLKVRRDESSTRVDSKVRICFSTSVFTFSRRDAQNEWKRRAAEG